MGMTVLGEPLDIAGMWQFGTGISIAVIYIVFCFVCPIFMLNILGAAHAHLPHPGGQDDAHLRVPPRLLRRAGGEEPPALAAATGGATGYALWQVPLPGAHPPGHLGRGQERPRREA